MPWFMNKLTTRYIELGAGSVTVEKVHEVEAQQPEAIRLPNNTVLAQSPRSSRGCEDRETENRGETVFDFSENEVLFDSINQRVRSCQVINEQESEAATAVCRSQMYRYCQIMQTTQLE